MRLLLIVVLLAVSSTIAAYSGTFVEDFSDGNLDEWHIRISPGPPPFPATELLKFENGYLDIDTMLGKEVYLVSLELGTGNAEQWDSYTLICRIRFDFKEDPEPPVSFHIEVRSSEGPEVQRGNEIFTPDNFQAMWIQLAPKQEIRVVSFQPNKGFPVEGDAELMTSRAKFSLERLEQPVASRWIPIKIVARGKFFEFYFDDHLVARYEDGKAGPGTVRFWTSGGLPVHLDDIAITGPRIPFLGGPHSVAPEARLATTWGEIKDSPQK